MTQQHDKAQQTPEPFWYEGDWIQAEHIVESVAFCAGVEGAHGKGLPPGGVREMWKALKKLVRNGLCVTGCHSYGRDPDDPTLTCTCGVEHAKAILARYTLSDEPEKPEPLCTLCVGSGFRIHVGVGPEPVYEPCPNGCKAPQEPVCSECGGRGYVSYLDTQGASHDDPGTPVNEPCPHRCEPPSYEQRSTTSDF